MCLFSKLWQFMNRDIQGWVNWAWSPVLRCQCFLKLSQWVSRSSTLEFTHRWITAPCMHHADCCPSLIASHPTLFICVAKGQHRQLGLSLLPTKLGFEENRSCITYHNWTYWFGKQINCFKRLYKTPRPKNFKIDFLSTQTCMLGYWPPVY